MKNFTFKLLYLSLLFSCLTLNAQEKSTEQFRNCGTDEYNALLLENHPKMMGSQAYEQLMAPKIAEIKAQLAENSERSLALQYTIPVVVHVIHNGEPIGTGANISDAQVISQIQVLNEDFRRVFGSRGWNTHPDSADVEVEFCLAQQTPDGCPTNGIDRIDMSSVSTTWSGPGGNTDSVLKPTTFWDASKYMNMWSVNFSSSSLLGYAQFPGGPANTDGVVSNYTYFGSNDAPGVTIPGAFNLGRTMTHEVGHYLGLYHTFQGGCFGSGDLCDDTPPVASANSNGSACIINNSCTNDVPDQNDMIENYMDYTTDACMSIFTNDQKARVISVMQTYANTSRPNTVTSNVCNASAAVNDDGSIQINMLTASGGACASEFTPNVRVQNWGTVTLTSATINYDIDGGTSTSYPWTGSLATSEFIDFNLPAITATGGTQTLNVSISSPNGGTDSRACNDTDNIDFSGAESFATTTQVHLTLLTDNWSNETTWDFKNEFNVPIYSGGPYNGTTDDNTTFNYSFDVDPDKCYTFTIYDSAGDGVCCSYGIGSYELKTDDNTVIFSGGEFGASEATNISTAVLSTEDFFLNNTITIYPNPTSDRLTIKLTNSNLPDGYKIYNMLGQIISENAVSNISDLEINTSNLSNGMYFIKVSKDNSIVTLPFIKN